MGDLLVQTPVVLHLAQAAERERVVREGHLARTLVVERERAVREDLLARTLVVERERAVREDLLAQTPAVLHLALALDLVDLRVALQVQVDLVERAREDQRVDHLPRTRAVRHLAQVQAAERAREEAALHLPQAPAVPHQVPADPVERAREEAAHILITVTAVVKEKESVFGKGYN